MYANSLRRQLIRQLLWLFIPILILGAAVAYSFAIYSATEANDLGLLDDALDLAKQVQVHDGKLVLELPSPALEMLLTNNEDKVTYVAWDDSGQIFSGDSRLLKLGMPPAKLTHFFKDTVLAGEENRAVILHGTSYGKSFFIAVSQTMHGRNQLLEKIFLGMLLPEGLLAIAAIAVTQFGVRRGLSPIELLRDEIIRRSPDDLRPIKEEPAPEELRPIIRAINELLERLVVSFASHRRFIANAAHQLRTPLAALRSQIEVGLERSPADSGMLLQQLLATAKRATHLANQMLSLARLEHTEQTKNEEVEVNLLEVVREAAADFVAPAELKGIEMDFDLESCQLKGSPLLLRELVANLIDNAVRYVSPKGQVYVRLRAKNGRALLIVEDNGPGVPDDKLNNLGVPFCRFSSAQAEGSGLGLAIAREIARLHAAKIYFERANASGGLRVGLEF